MERAAKAIPAEDADGADQTAGAHAAGNGNAVFQAEDAGSNRTGNSGGQGGRQPDAGIFDDITHLQHGCAKSLRHQAAPAVFGKAHDGKADHLGAAARRGGAACQTGEGKGKADSSGADGQGEDDTDQHRNDNAHEKRAKLSCPNNELTEAVHQEADAGTDKRTDPQPRKNGDGGGDENINFSFAADGFSKFRGNDDGKESTQRSTYRVGAESHGAERIQDQRRSGKGNTDGNGNGDTGGAAGVACGGDKPIPVELIAKRIQYGADEQRSEQAHGHGAHGIDKIELSGGLDIFAGKERGKSGGGH